ncbi:MAG: hypothetical protein AVDCRST_MAG79-304, partial [uncultured Thermoleophilia bacterium]
AAVPDRRQLRRGDGALHGAQRTREAHGGDGPPRVAAAPRPHPRGPVRHHRPPRAALRPGETDGHRVPHAERADRARPYRSDRGGGQPAGGGRAVPARRANAARRGRTGARRAGPATAL